MASNEQSHKPGLEEILSEPGIDVIEVLRFIASSFAPQSAEAADLLLEKLQGELEEARGLPVREIGIHAEIAEVALTRFMLLYSAQSRRSPGYDPSRAFAFAELAIRHFAEIDRFADVYSAVLFAENHEVTKKALSCLEAKREVFSGQRKVSTSSRGGIAMDYTALVSELEALLHAQRGNYEAAAMAHFQAGRLEEAYRLARREGVRAEIKQRVETAYLADLERGGKIAAALTVANEIGDERAAARLASQLAKKGFDQSLETILEIERLKSQLEENPTLALIKEAEELRSSLHYERKTDMEFADQLSLMIFDAYLARGNYRQAWKVERWVGLRDREQHPMIPWLHKLIDYAPGAFGLEESRLAMSQDSS